MKKIYLVPLLVVGLLVQHGNGQTGNLGDGRWVGNSSRQSSEKNRSCKPDCVASSRNVSDRSTITPQSGPQTKVDADSPLDPDTKQMVEAAIKELSEQSRISLQSSIDKFIDDNLAKNRDITDALNALKHNAATF